MLCVYFYWLKVKVFEQEAVGNRLVPTHRRIYCPRNCLNTCRRKQKLYFGIDSIDNVENYQLTALLNNPRPSFLAPTSRVRMVVRFTSSYGYKTSIGNSTNTGPK